LLFHSFSLLFSRRILPPNDAPILSLSALGFVSF
jgi:hypothetical protein